MKKYNFSYRRQKEEQLTDKLNDQLLQELSDEELFSFAEFNPENAERGGYSDYSYWGSTLRAFFQNKSAVFFLVLMVTVLVFTFVQPAIPLFQDAATGNYGM